MNMSFFEWYDRLGRPTLRNVGVLIIVLIGAAIATQFLFWGIFNREPAAIPMQNILVAALPYVIQGWQEWTRHQERKQQVSLAQPPVRGMAHGNDTVSQ